MDRKRWTADELAFDAKLREYIEKHRTRMEAKIKRPLNKRELESFWLWEITTEDREWDSFYGESL